MAKVTLSNTEKNLVLNQEIFLTKIDVIQKVYLLFNNADVFYKEQLKILEIIPTAIKACNGKISKGENYLQLPWVMLDSPNFFKGDHVFAVRTFFWWGNYISINFLTMGCFVDEIKDTLIKEKKNYEKWSLCIDESPWHHHFKEDNFVQLNQVSETQIKNLAFVKLAKKIPLQEWDNVEYFLKENFLELINLMNQTSFQAYEKAL